MEFSPANPIVKCCLQGMMLQENGQPEEAGRVFRRACDEATSDFEKFLAAYYVARLQSDLSDRLQWYETALQLALSVNDEAVQSAFPVLYTHIAQCQEELGNSEAAQKNRELAASFPQTPSDKGPFYHGTKADLKIGDHLTAGGGSNYQEGLKMNHIYFTAIPYGAGLAAALAKGAGKERVYIIEPTGDFENDPNVTNNKFPGNPTRSYRSEAPLKIVGELEEWAGQSPEEIQKWREKLANNKGEIIN